MGQKKEKTPHQKLDALESATGWGTLIILAGILLEIVAFFFLGHQERLAALVANALIAIGLIIEYVAIRLTIIASGEAKQESDERIAISEAQAAEANARTKEAELKLAQLEKKITPRVITDEQAEEIIAKVKPFAEMPFGVAADPAAEYAFINRLIMVLQRAGWKWMRYSVEPSTLPIGAVMGFEIPESQVSGVQLRINRSKLDDFMKPAQELASVLTQALEAGVSIAADPWEPPRGCSPDMIHIEIHRKL